MNEIKFMQFHFRYVISSLLLIIFVGIFFSCSNANIRLMAAQKIDTNANQNTLKTFLALGDSYTIGQSVPESERYPVQTVKLLNNSGIHFSAPLIIAATGWTTEDLQKSINGHQRTDSVYDIVTLLIGVNNQYQGKSQLEYKDQFRALVQRSIQLAGNKVSHVIIISIPDYSLTPFAGRENASKLIAGEIDSFNQINKEVAQNYGANYLNITGETRKAGTDDSLLASDGLHYSGKEYAIWAHKLASLIMTVLK
jgi:lysophospholipase L1-like esterase